MFFCQKKWEINILYFLHWVLKRWIFCITKEKLVSFSFNFCFFFFVSWTSTRTVATKHSVEVGKTDPEEEFKINFIFKVVVQILYKRCSLFFGQILSHNFEPRHLGTQVRYCKLPSLPPHAHELQTPKKKKKQRKK